MKINKYVCASILLLIIAGTVMFWGLTSNQGQLALNSHIIVAFICVFFSYLFYKNRNETDEQRVLKWENKRKKGMTLFILIHGILSWGLPIGFVKWTLTTDFIGDDLLSSAVISFSVFLIAGALFGYYLWNHWGEKYEEILKDAE